jgi:two-component system, NtrC family, sensor kinase
MHRPPPEATAAARSRAEMYEELRRADRATAVTRLTSCMAHALGTPLNVVSGRAAMIASGELTSREIRDSAEVIAAQVGAITAMLRATLADYRRRRPRSRQPVSVAEVVAQAGRLIALLAPTRGVSLSIDDRCHVTAEIDPTPVLQLLTIVMSHLVEVAGASASDGGVLTVTISSDVIDRPQERRAAPGRYLHLVIEHDRATLAADVIEDSRDPFSASDPRAGRMDLGLFVCHGICREHGGWIALERGPDTGGRVHVYLHDGGAV